jgi:hypothetical protein
MSFLSRSSTAFDLQTSLPFSDGYLSTLSTLSNVPNITELMVTQPEYFRLLAQQLSSFNRTQIAYYISWRTIHDVVSETATTDNTLIYCTSLVIKQFQDFVGHIFRFVFILFLFIYYYYYYFFFLIFLLTRSCNDICFLLIVKFWCRHK